MTAAPTKTTMGEPSPRATTAQRKALALQRIEASRTQLILCMLPATPKAPAPPASASTPDFLGFANALKKRMERNGLVHGGWRLLRAWGRRWWTRQPWHAPAALVISTVAHEAKPAIRDHPWAALSAGAVVGATLVAALPWATRSLRGQVRPWRHHVGGLLWNQLAQTSVQVALASALTAWITERAQTPPAGAARASSPPSTTEPPTPPPTDA